MCCSCFSSRAVNLCCSVNVCVGCTPVYWFCVSRRDVTSCVSFLGSFLFPQLIPLFVSGGKQFNSIMWHRDVLWEYYCSCGSYPPRQAASLPHFLPPSLCFTAFSFLSPLSTDQSHSPTLRGHSGYLWRLLCLLRSRYFWGYYCEVTVQAGDILMLSAISYFSTQVSFFSNGCWLAYNKHDWCWRHEMIVITTQQTSIKSCL